jgi:hypothetical protein
VQFVEHAAGLDVENLGADAADVEIGGRQGVVVDEAAEVIHQAARVVDEQGPGLGRESGPGRLEA